MILVPKGLHLPLAIPPARTALIVGEVTSGLYGALHSLGINPEQAYVDKVPGATGSHPVSASRFLTGPSR